MLSIKTCRSIINLASKQQTQQIFSVGYAKVVKKGRPGKKVQDEDQERVDSSKYDVKVSKASYQKIIQRFSTLFRRPDSIDLNRSDEEQELRKIIYNYNKYSEEIVVERDREEEEKLNHQWDAIMELPEDLRKIALLIQTDQEMPLIPFLYDTPPTKVDPKKSVQLKKKDKSLKPSQRELLTNSIQS
ncbi:hypothetical protein RB653_007685 [Dictyostelium firmibasis]|uniref:Uncharacterized protein n=1 Tax=Dictyostelium firmibasis TaxID=79012 RepID=A0AAN7YP91_9MYCE